MTMPDSERVETLSTTVATNIRIALIRKKRSQLDLAQHLGISPAAVSKRLNGYSPIAVDELQRIATFLQVRVADLINDEDAA